MATRSYGDHHATTADTAETAQRGHPTIQADVFFCEERGEDSKYILLMVDMWTRYVQAEPLKVRNKRSVGEAMARFIGSLDTLALWRSVWTMRMCLLLAGILQRREVEDGISNHHTYKQEL